MLAQLACALFCSTRWPGSLRAACGSSASAPVTIECWPADTKPPTTPITCSRWCGRCADTDSGHRRGGVRAALAIRRPVARGTRCTALPRRPHRVACMARRTGRGGRGFAARRAASWAGPASADLTLTDGRRPRPEDGAASEMVRAPDGEVGLVGRLAWAMAQAASATRRASGWPTPSRASEPKMDAERQRPNRSPDA